MAAAERRTTAAVVLGGWAAGLAVIRALASAGVPVVAVCHSRGEPGLVSRYASPRLVGPHPEDAEDEFVEFLLELGERYPGALLVPTTDEGVTAVARHKRALVERFAVACMDHEIVERFLDKWETAQLAERHGVPAPLTFIPESMADLERRRDQLAYPCVVKPRDSHLFYRVFGKKMDKVEGFDELVAAWRAADAAGLRVLVQEFVPGPDSHGANYNAYVHDGRVAVACTAQRLRSTPPQIGFPRAVVSRSLPQLAAPAGRLLAGMGVEGFANVEFKRDARDGVYKLMEVNGHHNLSGHLSVRCGVNFPLIQYDHLVDGVLSVPERFATGVYWIGFPSDITAGIRHRHSERLGASEQLQPYLRPHVFDVFSVRDPVPITKPLAPRLRNLRARTWRRISAAAGASG